MDYFYDSLMVLFGGILRDPRPFHIIWKRVASKFIFSFIDKKSDMGLDQYNAKEIMTEFSLF